MTKRQQKKIKANKRGLKATEKDYRQHKKAHCFKGTLEFFEGALALSEIFEIRDKKTTKGDEYLLICIGTSNAFLHHHCLSKFDCFLSPLTIYYLLVGTKL